MRSVCVVLGLCALAVGLPLDEEKDAYYQRKYKVNDKELLKRQKDILLLLVYPNQQTLVPKILKTASEFSVENNIDLYTNQAAVKQFLYFYRLGFSPKGEIFSEFYPRKLKLATSLFELLYYAKDYDTFYKTAAWARVNINEGLYLYALSVAVIHRPDTYGIILPPIYELNPYYFYNGDVIQKAQWYRQENPNSNEVYTIYANYSQYYNSRNLEYPLSYYTEDVGINAYYYYYNLYYPLWLNGEHYKLKNDRRGEQFYYTHQQLLARYYLERLSNGLGKIDLLHYDRELPAGYYPLLRYPNGQQFPSRPKSFNVHDYFEEDGHGVFEGSNAFLWENLLDYERRIREVIDLGYAIDLQGKRVQIYTPDGIELFASLIEGNADSINPSYYGNLQTLGRNLLGNSFSWSGRLPSALEHIETSLFDPAFYRFYKRIILYFQSYKSRLPPYTYNELAYPGVKIESVEFDRLTTFFDYFDADISSAVRITSEDFVNREPKPEIRVRQKRLNHKPFSYKIKLTAEQAGETVIRIYLGPKHDEFDRPFGCIHENRLNFVQIGEIKYSLKQGENVIEQNSIDNWYAVDKTSIRDLYKRLEVAINGTEGLQLDGTEAYFGFPLRYLLPKGRRGGQTFQVYVIANPFKPSSLKKEETAGNYYYPRVGTGGNYNDALPFGFPFDRPIIDVETFNKLPNAYLKDVVIYHKETEEINASTQADSTAKPL